MVFNTPERGVVALTIIVSTRLMRWKKEWKSLLFWLIFPLLLTFLVLQSVEAWQAKTKVPIALVVEEETEMVTHLIEEIAQSELLLIHYMELDEALHKLEQHELDSVFVIREGYEDHILANRRNQLIEAYSSNRSFAYRTVVEMIASIAQQDAARSKAAFVIRQLYKEHGMEDEWSYSDIIASSQERQQSKALLQTSFSFYAQTDAEEAQSLSSLSVKGVWSFFALLTTFFLFDWVVKENRSLIRPRWHFAQLSFKAYAFGTFWLYSGLLMIVDIATVLMLSTYYQEHITSMGIVSLLVFRITINLLAFLLATVFSQTFLYYISGTAVSLFLIVVGGAIIPLEGITRKWLWVELFSPVQALLSETIPAAWLIVLAVLMILWFQKGRKSYA
jgi:ABC-2 type transport system permease protein